MSIAVPSESRPRSVEAAPAPSTSPTTTERPPADSGPVTVIERRPGWHLLDLRDLWRFRELGFFLAWRDVKVRYKQTVLGAAWALIQPLATMLIFTLFLGKVASLSGSSVPYPLYVLSGLIAWTFLSTAVTTAGQSVVNNHSLVTKVYFPRLLIPMASVGASLVDLVVALGVLVVAMIGFGILPGFSVVLAPLVFGLLVLTTIGIGALLSALTVTYRDFRYVVPFMVQAWMFATPCIYLQDLASLGERSRMLLPLNPAYGLILGFRSTLLGQPLDLQALAVSGGVGLGLFAVGCLYFRHAEKQFADVI